MTYKPEAGHRVRGVVEGVARRGVDGDREVLITLESGKSSGYLPADIFTWERLPDPEPEWEIGDLAIDVLGLVLIRCAGPLWRRNSDRGCPANIAYPLRRAKVVPE